MFDRVSLANGIVNCSIIGSVYVAELLIFFGAQMLFTAFLRLPPLPVFALVAVAVAVRAIEILYADRTVRKIRREADNLLFRQPWLLV
jgi:hypothetical protein